MLIQGRTNEPKGRRESNAPSACTKLGGVDGTSRSQKGQQKEGKGGAMYISVNSVNTHGTVPDWHWHWHLALALALAVAEA